MAAPPTSPPRILILLAGPRTASGGRQAGSRDTEIGPRSVTAAELGADALHPEDLTFGADMRGRVLQRLPAAWQVAVEGVRQARDYDAILTWNESVAWPAALLLLVVRRARRPRHVAILIWPFDRTSPSRARRFFKDHLLAPLARHRVDRFLVWAPEQRRRLIAEWGITAVAVPACHKGIDTEFWQPDHSDGVRICAVGREMRDYETLVTALRGLDVPCHIAAATGPNNPGFRSVDRRARQPELEALPPQITVGPKSVLELRALYASARFVVVPVLPTDTDNGVTTVKEAMSMGRAIIASATIGRTDLLQDGVTCLLVPPRDPDALRAAIVRLWGDPELCERLGTAGRSLVVARAGLDQWRHAILAAASCPTGVGHALGSGGSISAS